MQLKKEFIKLSNHFNKNINEDKLLFIGMFLNFYLTENNFKNQKEIKENIKIYFKKDKTPMEIVKEVINNQKAELKELLNNLFLAMTNKEENKSLKFTKNQDLILNSLSTEKSFDQILEETKIAQTEILSELINLEIMGLIKSIAGGRYKKIL